MHVLAERTIQLLPSPQNRPIKVKKRMKFLWLDEAIIKILERSGGVKGLDDLMEELWRMTWIEKQTGCSGWIGYKENGAIKHWCKQAWKLLKIMEQKGLIKIEEKHIKIIGNGGKDGKDEVCS